MTIINSRLLYSALEWVNSISKFFTSRDTLLGSQRTAAIRIARYYRTVSCKKALVLAGTYTPANLLEIEQGRIRGRSRVEMVPINSTKTEERARIIFGMIHHLAL